MTDNVTSIRAKLDAARKRAEERGVKLPPPPSAPSAHSADEPKGMLHVDSETRVEFGRTEEDRVIDDAIDGIDILEAYDRWCGKMKPNVGRKREGIMISCPNPSHPDRNPSAWINLDNQLWYCPGCGEGGDKLDIAAWHFGFPVPGYKDGATFHALRKKIAEDRGVTFVQSVTGKTLPVPPAPPAVRDLIPPAPAEEPDEPLAEVVAIDGSTDDDDDEIPQIELDWKSIIPQDTFLDVYMRQTTEDDLPEEYHFWNGMLAIGMALGRDTKLRDRVPVYGNLFVCILGGTGAGKSQSYRHLKRLVTEALPYDGSDPLNDGVKVIPNPGSAEYLVKSFIREIPKKSTLAVANPIRGVVEFNELSALIARSQRRGSSLVPTLQDFYDTPEVIGTGSLTSGEFRAERPYASVFTTSQPAVLRSMFTKGDADSGFLNRWLFVVGKEKEYVPLGGAVIDITPAIAPLKAVHDWSLKMPMLEWDQEAADMFVKFAKETIRPDQKRNEKNAILTRLDLLCKKLVLLFAANMHSAMATIEAVKQMIEVYPYLLKCYAIPGASIGMDDANILMEKIMKYATGYQRRYKKPVTAAKVNTRFRGEDKNLLLRCLKTLVQLQHMEEMHNTGPGKRTTYYNVVGLDA